MRKRFVKLLLFKVDTQYRLLYGFSSETEQSSYPWKALSADKKGQKLIAKAILSPNRRSCIKESRSYIPMMKNGRLCPYPNSVISLNFGTEKNFLC